MTVTVRVAGTRKYGPIWQRLKEQGICKVECLTIEDTLTTINGVKKEKAQDKKKPKDKVLKIETSAGEAGTIIKFQLIIDTSINNL